MSASKEMTVEEFFATIGRKVPNLTALNEASSDADVKEAAIYAAKQMNFPGCLPIAYGDKCRKAIRIALDRGLVTKAELRKVRHGR